VYTKLDTVAPQHKQLILVAENIPEIHIVIERVISQLGYTALLVSDGQAALEVAETHRAELVCAVLGFSLARLNGLDAAVGIRQFAPNLPIVLMSGYVPATAIEKVQRLQGANILAKPFAIAELRSLLQQLLTQPQISS
jgi:CheY-like chemotaxis protein